MLPTIEATASPRMVRGTMAWASPLRSTISAVAMVWPVASAIEMIEKMISGSAATISNLGIPKGNNCGTAISGPCITPDTSSLPRAAASSVPAISPSMTEMRCNVPVNTREKITVSAMVASASPTLTGSAKCASPERPVMVPP